MSADNQTPSQPVETAVSATETTQPSTLLSAAQTVATEPVELAADSVQPAPESTEDKAQETTAVDVPERYEFKTPDGYTSDPQITGEFETVAKELKLSQEQAQKLYDFGPKISEMIKTQQAQMVEKVKAEWLEASVSDKEFGGDKYETNLAIARKALDTCASDEFKKLLHESGLERHPEVIRTFLRIGKSVSEDSFVNGAGGVGPSDRAAKMYPSMQN